MRAEGRAALLPYLTAGFPTPAASLQALQLGQRCGADFLEVGVPFSDPLADGPTIQRSTQVALEQGMTVAGVLELLRRAELRIPVVIMTYLNPVLAYGLDRFLGDAAAAGASGLLLTDLPSGADPAIEDAVRASPLALIRLVAPTTTAERLPRVVSGATGFVYLISRLGVTGVRSSLAETLAPTLAAVRRATTLPVAVGFGIANARQGAEVASIADGVVVGSALIDALGQGGLPAAERLLRELRAAMERRSP